ncbi:MULTISPECIES: beta-ketoacyl synthase N-terminal-like domain-containing protein [Streptomyces]|uniref:Beta-ketoacyl synthase N-terminal-like domain-containing protein n=1 Tax=Streptomyces silvisoli TaxID=3034235 RepID=A0ABT5ZL14_9ACTN|nr:MULTISPECIES: beta-ketoacyl synthase N-terminal-like domain-containing protein [Streptomyces]MDF3290504.1 beta-ketoacyl synthase N-terminal-like domain-containing protein [Streptomyces silvisoli]
MTVERRSSFEGGGGRRAGMTTAERSSPFEGGGGGRTAWITGVGLAVDGLRGAADLLAEYTRHPDGFDPRTALTGREMRHRDRASRLALRSAGAALRDAGLLSDDGGYHGPARRTAVVVSSNLGNLDTVCSFLDTIDQETSKGLKATGLPHTSSNSIAGWVAIGYGLTGPNLTLCNGPSSGLDALHWARILLVTGRADLVLVTGVEPDNEYTARLLADEGERRWPDSAASVVVEAAEHADSRGARARSVLHGYARAADVGAAMTAAAEGGGPLGLLAAEHSALDALPGAATAPAVTDLSRWAGRQSGALGVLQAAAAVAHFDRGADGAVLAASCRLPGGTAAALLCAAPTS